VARLVIWTAWILLAVSSAAARAEPQWMTLPPTPSLPAAVQSGSVPVGSARIWYATYGRGAPVVLLHGGLANSDYWGLLARALQSRYRVIVIDSRGHGRSTNDGKPYGYDLMTDDVVAVLDHLKIRTAAIVGWSDGAILGLDMAIRHPERLTRLFAFAANSDPSGVADISASPVFDAYIERASHEYEKLSQTPKGYKDFLAAITKMWETQPDFTPAQLGSIKAPTWIVDGDHDEAIKRDHTERLASLIPGAGLLIQPQVSHFSFIQDPAQFNADVLHFLEKK
jgi:pimeloyl-ACP methyl ester carboxylesterase